MGRLSAACAAIVAMFVFTAAASAIVYGEPDGGGHPNVGALLAPQAYSDGTWAGCTGTLISPTVFLTAEHCDFGVDRIAVTFASRTCPARARSTGARGTATRSTAMHKAIHSDVAVVVLDKAVTGITPARLPAAESLSNLPSNQGFTSVGYGAQSLTIDHGPTFHYADTRFVATSDTLLAINKPWLRISMNPARGDGGTCYGDSGGPNFLGAGGTETDIVAATTITGDFMCRATNVAYRLDTASARAFLGQFVTLP